MIPVCQCCRKELSENTIGVWCVDCRSHCQETLNLLNRERAESGDLRHKVATLEASLNFERRYLADLRPLLLEVAEASNTPVCSHTRKSLEAIVDRTLAVHAAKEASGG